MISAPGLHLDIDEDDYHADPCPEPSLSRSVALKLVRQTPRHAFIAHPRLDPEFEVKDDEPKFDIGTVAHAVMTGRGRGPLEVKGYDAWRSDAAKRARKLARDAGFIPLLSDQYERVMAMRAAVLAQLPDHDISEVFDPEHGRGEVVATWVDPAAGWCRIMIDWLTKDVHLWDFKATEIEELNADKIGRHCSDMRYEFQHAFYERGIEHLFPELSGRVKFNILFAQVKPPFQIMPVQLPADAIAKGRANVVQAVETWAARKAEGQWPRYIKKGIQTVEYPPWAVAEFVNP